MPYTAFEKVSLWPARATSPPASPPSPHSHRPPQSESTDISDFAGVGDANAERLVPGMSPACLPARTLSGMPCLGTLEGAFEKTAGPPLCKCLLAPGPDAVLECLLPLLSGVHCGRAPRVRPGGQAVDTGVPAPFQHQAGRRLSMPLLQRPSRL